MPTLNPSAPSFTRTTAVTTPLKSRLTSTCHDLDVSHLGLGDTGETIIRAPANTPVNDSPESPKIAASLGQGWKSTFPLTPFKPSFKSSPSPPRTATLSPNSTDIPFTPNHCSKSPSVPTLPSEETRSQASRGFTPNYKTKFALKHLNPHNFTPFDDDEDFAGVIDFSRQPTSPSPKRFPVGHNFASFDRGSDSDKDIIYAASDFGEGRNVYLPELHPKVTEDVLRTIGQSFGRLVSVKVERSGNMSPDSYDQLPDGVRRSRIYAFVMFDTAAGAREFMRYLQEQHIPCQYGKETPHLKQKALEDPHSSNLYVAEIPLDATEEEMRELFYPGVISSIRFLTDDMGNRRGTAMVRLQSRAQAEEAIRRLDLKVTMPGCTKALQVRIADSENQKQLKKLSARPDPFASRRPSVTATPPRTGLSPIYTGVGEDILMDHIKACAEELRRRQSSDAQSRSSSRGHSTPITPVSPSYERRPSVPTVDVLDSLFKSHAISPRRTEPLSRLEFDSYKPDHKYARDSCDTSPSGSFNSFGSFKDRREDVFRDSRSRF